MDELCHPAGDVDRFALVSENSSSGIAAAATLPQLASVGGGLVPAVADQAGRDRVGARPRDRRVPPVLGAPPTRLRGPAEAAARCS